MAIRFYVAKEKDFEGKDFYREYFEFSSGASSNSGIVDDDIRRENSKAYDLFLQSDERKKADVANAETPEAKKKRIEHDTRKYPTPEEMEAREKADGKVKGHAREGKSEDHDLRNPVELKKAELEKQGKKKGE